MQDLNLRHPIPRDMLPFTPNEHILHLYSSNHNIYGNGYEDYNIFLLRCDFAYSIP